MLNLNTIKIIILDILTPDFMLISDLLSLVN